MAQQLCTRTHADNTQQFITITKLGIMNSLPQHLRVLLLLLGHVVYPASMPAVCPSWYNARPLELMGVMHITRPMCVVCLFGTFMLYAE